MFPGCLNTYSHIASLRKHILRKHPNQDKKSANNNQDLEKKSVTLQNEEFDKVLSPVAVTTNETSDSEMPSESDSENDGKSVYSIKNDLGKFILNLRINHKIPAKSTEFIIKKFHSLLQSNVDQTTEKVKELLVLSDLKVEELFQPLNSLGNNLSDLSTVYLQNKFIENYDSISPVEIALDENTNYVYDIPIMDTLKIILQHDDALSHIQ